MGHRYSRAFALPVVMITSVVMMMVLLSGLTAATSVNVGLRAQYEDKIKQTAAASGLAMAKDCIARNDNAITWTNTKPLKPNTNCQGVEQFSCPASGTAADGCWLLKSGTYRSKFVVGVSTSSTGETKIDSQAILYQLRQSNNAVLRQYTQNKRSTVKSDVTVTSGISSKLSSITAGQQHSCGLDVSGSAWCWGYNAQGQLGNGTTSNSTTPVAVNMPAGIKFVSLHAGGFFTCGLASNGKVYCWGYNANGELGIGSTGTNYSSPVALAPNLPADVTLRSISTGLYHSCGVGSNGKVYCWGYNYYGQIGNGNTTNSPYSIEIAAGVIPPNTTFKQVSAGGYYTCALAESNAIYCWGLGGSGQLGRGSTADSSTAVSVLQGNIPAGLTIQKISAGLATMCVLASNNKVYCWGHNNEGELGDGTTANKTSPVALLQGAIPTGANNVIQDLTLGYYHSCVLVSNSGPFCWGYNSYGQIGNGTSGTNRLVPVAVSSGTNKIRSFATGGWQHNCAVTSDAKALCWGLNDMGQLGRGNNTNSPTPGEVTSGASQMPLGVQSVDIGGAWGVDTACAITIQSRLYCWGNNAAGQFANNNTTNSSTPIAGLSNVLAWVPDMPVTSVSVGGISMCLTTYATGGAGCSGYNGYGQLGNGTTTDSPDLVQISQGARPAGVEFTSVKTKSYVSCGLGTDMKAYCWGLNDYGQLGDGTTTNRTAPVAVSQGAIPAGVVIREVAPFNGSACALASNGKVYCWGANVYGQLGDGTTTNRTAPVAVSQGAIPAGITAKTVEGDCLLASNDWVYCWGYNYYGQNGDGTTTNRTAPVAVSQGAIPAGVKLRDMSSGESSHRCAVGTNGWAYCWGANSAGQLGDGTTTNRTAPVAVSQGAIPAGVTINSITTGPANTCVIASNLRLYCWGENSGNQLGNGTTAPSSVPVAVPHRLTLRGSGSYAGSSMNNDSLLFTY